MEPVLNKPVSTWLKWNDEFDGDLSEWNQSTFIDDARHRTGNQYLKLDGTIDLNQVGHKVPGRWAARYDLYRDKCQFIRNGHLVMKGHAVKAQNLYRENFMDYTGTVHPYGDWQLFTSWLTCKEHFGPGSILEVRVNLENQQMRGHRWNFWLMPVIGNAYDADISSAEIDSPEVENPSRVAGSTFGGKALMKVVAGSAGDTPNGIVDLLKLGIDIRKGWHTFTTVWNHDGSLDFLCDGILCNQDPRHVTATSEIIMAREMNSGVKNTTNKWENNSTGPKVPADPGLTGQSVILDVDLMEADEVIVDYVRVYDILDSKKEDPDVDLGELSIDEQIILLIKKYDDTAEQLNSKDSHIDDLTRQMDALLDEIEELKKKATSDQSILPETLILLRQALERAML